VNGRRALPGVPDQVAWGQQPGQQWRDAEDDPDVDVHSTDFPAETADSAGAKIRVEDQQSCQNEGKGRSRMRAV
jgi:hypothetical protein